MHYILADPFGKESSGVTTYNRLALNRMLKVGINASLVSRQQGETIEVFAHRLAEKAKDYGTDVWVEAPESLASTRYITNKTKIHIRLHLSREVGKILQGQQHNKLRLAFEQTEINRASMVSAPSRAAVEMARFGLNLPQSIHLYPNPAPEFVKRNKKIEFDLLFIGRWQRLKGSHFIVELARSNPRLSIAILTDSVSHKIPNNIKSFRPHSIDKIELITKAKRVVIPSLAETVSMVGLEAASTGTQTLAWSHLGICEYLNDQAINQIKYKDITHLGYLSHEDINHSGIAESCEESIRRVNHGFDEAIQNILTQESSITNGSILKITDTSELQATIRMIMKEEIMQRQKGEFSRKLRKLWRDPAGFYKDSKLKQIFTRPGSELPQTLVPQAIIAEAVLNTERLPLQKLTHPRSNPHQKEETSETKDKNTFTAKHAVENKLNASIKISEYIKFEMAAGNNNEWMSLFLYPKGSEEEAHRLIDYFHTHEDFFALRQKNLRIGDYELEDIAQSTYKLINRIDLSNKNKVSTFGFLVLLDPPENLMEALRSCGTNQKTIVISTKNKQYNNQHVDALIRLGEHVNSDNRADWRRIIHVQTFEAIHLAVRRVMQEQGPKLIDVLLPLFGEFEHQAELLSFSTKNFQGIIYMKPGYNAALASTMRDLYQQITPLIDRMLISESVYMRYRSQCEEIETGKGDLASFIELSLLDGVIYDIRAS